MREPPIPDPAWPRYSARALPPYRFVPGRAPHPTAHPDGHSYGKEPARPPALPADRWRENEPYLHGIDLYNQAYWWECHEEFEGLWNAAGRTTPQGQFLQGLIQVAAANLKRFMGSSVHRVLALEGLARFAGLPDRCMGVDLRAFAADVREFHEGRTERPPLIRLEEPA